MCCIYIQSVFLIDNVFQDQAVKVAEAVEHEAELKRLREENADLKKRVNDFSSVESAKKKLEVKVEQLEGKVRYSLSGMSIRC
jgi:hypothetical protein